MEEIVTKYTILLAMSTFPYSMIVSDFKDETGKRIDYCISQLEPVVKHMIDQLDPSKKNHIDIIMLCSNKTVNNLFQSHKTEKSNKKFVNTMGKSRNIEDKDVTDELNALMNSYSNIQLESPVDFFISRINEYFENKINTTLSIKSSIKNKDLCTTFDYGDLTYYQIPFSEDPTKENFDDEVNKYTLFASVERTVKVLKELNPNHRYFWVDTHGSFRDLSLIINAVLSILKRDHIIPIKVYGTDTSTDMLKPQEQAFRMFDFISAMNDFLDYGKAYNLIDYYNSHNKFDSNHPCRKVLNAMEKVSEGTTHCSPNLYKEGLKELVESIDNLEKSSTKVDSMFQVLIDYIKDDYKKYDLLDPEKQTSLNIIDHCFDKGLYQQTLTFIESLMPEAFFKSKAFYYHREDNRIVNLAKKYDHQNFQDNHTYVFNWYINNKKFYFFDNRTAFYNGMLKDNTKLKLVRKGLSVREVENLMEILEDHNALDSLSEYTDAKKDKNYQAIRVIKLCGSESGLSNLKDSFPPEKLYFNNGKYVTIQSDLNVDDRKKVGQLLRIHLSLKKVRNMYNHLDTKNDRATKEELNKAIEKYIELAKQINLDV